MIERYLAVATVVVVAMLISAYAGPIALIAFLVGLVFLAGVQPTLP